VPSFQGLGDLPGDIFYSQAFGLSPDGSMAVGWSWGANGLEAFKWTSAGGMVGLGDLPGANEQSIANAVSANGVIVGAGNVNGTSEQAFRYTAGGGMVGPGMLSGDNLSSARGVSNDGAVIVGTSTMVPPFGPGSFQATRWTAATGMVGLGGLSNGTFQSQANGVSADGNVVVGQWGGRAFRWTESTGMVALDYSFNGNPQGAGAQQVSPDGTIVVGYVHQDGIGDGAARWTASEGWVPLGHLAGGHPTDGGAATDLSSDGAIIVGSEDNIAIIWDAANGIRDLQSQLISMGLDLSGWNLQWANGISDGGTTITGWGINPAGQDEAFIATIPEPGALTTLMLATALALGRRRRQ